MERPEPDVLLAEVQLEFWGQRPWVYALQQYPSLNVEALAVAALQWHEKQLNHSVSRSHHCLKFFHRETIAMVNYPDNLSSKNKSWFNQFSKDIYDIFFMKALMIIEDSI